jgi:hypothetical protein
METQLIDYVKRTLGARVPDEECSRIVDILEKKAGILYVTDLTDTCYNRELLYPDIPVAQVNKLYLSWTQSAEYNKTSDSIIAASTVNGTPAVQDERIFEPNYTEIGYQSYLESEKPLPDGLYQKIYHGIVLQYIAKYGTSNPGLPYFRKVALKVAQRYPHHFMDKIDGISCGTANGLANRINSHRLYKTAQKDRGDKRPISAVLGTDPDEFSPAYPSGYTAEGLELERGALKEIYSSPSNTWDLAAISNKMKLTYPLLREAINDPKLYTDKLLEDWPFLRKYEHFILHFKRLTKCDPEIKIALLLNEKSEVYFNYFTQFTSKHETMGKIYLYMKAALPPLDQEKNNIKLLALLKMITLYMAEDFSNMILLHKVINGYFY